MEKDKPAMLTEVSRPWIECNLETVRCYSKVAQNPAGRACVPAVLVPQNKTVSHSATIYATHINSKINKTSVISLVT